MRRTWILLAVFAMLIGLLAVPGTALAKPGNGNGQDKVSGDGYTCADFHTENPVDWMRFGAAQGGFSITGLGPGEAACWDWDVNEAGYFRIEFSTDDQSDPYVLGLLLRIQDSMPGDICWETYLKEGPLVDEALTVWVPKSELNACVDGDNRNWTDSDDNLVFLVSVGTVGNLDDHRHGGPNHPQPTDINVTVEPVTLP